MKKYIQSMMAFAAIVSFASCSSEDNNTTIENESATKVMTFTATQEGNEASTRAILSGTNIHWESDDKISIFDGTKNNQFTLKEGAGTKSATFQGVAASAETYTAVYPYQSEATLSGTSVEKVTLKATQNATANSFDKEAALMIAEGDNTTLTFKNVVGYVKVKPNFDCKRIELMDFDNSAVLAGTGTVSYNNGKPTLDLSNATTKYYAITLTGDIKAGNYYYIAVPPVTLKAGWTIKFTTKDGTKVYSRKGTNDITFTRNKVTNLGEFDINGTNWYNPRGDKVRADQEVDLGLTINIGTKNYKVIFAKSNLTAAGLATSEYDYGDYFAWGATEPWYKSYTIASDDYPTVTSDGWKGGHTSGYASGTAPTFSPEYTSGKDFEMSDDPARKILGGDWQLPTKEIWEKLTSSYKWSWNDISSTTTKKGMEVKNKSTNKSIFLPAAGFVNEKSFDLVRSHGYYWSGTAGIWPSDAYRLHFASNFTPPEQPSSYRYFGSSVRPVRLVPVD